MTTDLTILLGDNTITEKDFAIGTYYYHFGTHTICGIRHKKHDTILLSFLYRPLIINIIKSLPVKCRGWNRDTKHWFVTPDLRPTLFAKL
mgnify:FL=1